jgi:hypothetical protein
VSPLRDVVRHLIEAVTVEAVGMLADLIRHFLDWPPS